MQTGHLSRNTVKPTSGGGLAAMLASALAESGQFIVVERAQLSQILSEQQLKAQGLVAKDGGPQLGRLLGAQLLVFGSVTDFTTQEMGGGFSIGYAGGQFDNVINGGLSPQFAKGRVVIDIRVVDATTGEIVASRHIKESLTRFGLDMSVTSGGLSVGANAFYKTPLGKAARKAITRAVQEIAAAAQRTPWRGRVVAFDGRYVAINAGSASGVGLGDRFTVKKTARTFVDPDTGRKLGLQYKELGWAEVVSVENEHSIGKFSATGGDTPKRGDFVFIAQRPVRAVDLDDSK